MPRRDVKHSQPAEWQISRISGKGAVYIGTVESSDADAAIRLAISKYDIEPRYHDRVAARPIVKAAG